MQTPIATFAGLPWIGRNAPQAAIQYFRAANTRSCTDHLLDLGECDAERKLRVTWLRGLFGPAQSNSPGSAPRVQAGIQNFNSQYSFVVQNLIVNLIMINGIRDFIFTE